MTELSLGEWLPDQADYKNPGLVQALNCYPSSGGYAPFEVPNATTDVSTETVVGSELFIRNGGTPLVCAGSSTRLLIRTSGGVTETTGYSALASDSTWQFERFNDLVIAVSPENVPQYLTDIDTDTAWSALPGSPPRAACIGKVDDFLVMGDLTDIAGLGSPTVPNRVRWSARNNPAGAWVTDRGELSDYRDLDPKYGRVTAIVGGRFGLVFQERAVWRMVYVGAPSAFQFDLVSADRGCVATGSAVTLGFETFYLSQDGFRVTNGSQDNAIGGGRINEWFEGEVDSALLRRVHGAIHWPKRCIVWAFVPSGSSGFTRQAIYSFVESRWSEGNQMFDYLVQTKQDALTLSDLGTLFPGGLGTMSAYQLGTSEWKARDRSLAVWSASGSGSAFAPLSGSTAAASWTTGDHALTPGRRTHVTGAMPIIENETGNTTIQIVSKSRQGGTPAVSTATTQGADGYCPQKVDNWFHAFRMQVPAGDVWDNALGFWVRANESGSR